jgi:hypothetical protein
VSPTVHIGARFTPRRGRRHLCPLVVRQIHRKDRSVTAVLDSGERREIRLSDLTKNYKPDPT